MLSALCPLSEITNMVLAGFWLKEEVGKYVTCSLWETLAMPEVECKICKIHVVDDAWEGRRQGNRQGGWSSDTSREGEGEQR